ncbi:MAG TPA: translation elongation factor Ts [Candidatus Limnocylindria bacterium]|nr:translation elongation factor Ts [Candidatus Limnocylindria bacterium]
MTKDLIKELRELTGAGILEIKNALAEIGHDKDKVIEHLRKKGALKAGKKADRIANEGIVESYIHPGSRVGVLVEVNCETDFVARTDDFKQLAKDLALHIAAANPLYISIGDVPAEIVEKEKEIYKVEVKGKPEDIVNKILEGKIAKYYEEACLMEQPFAKNSDLKVKDVVSAAVAKMGENVVVKRFARFVLGN